MAVAARPVHRENVTAIPITRRATTIAIKQTTN